MTDSKIPSILYGTAWKKSRTKELTTAALQCGFRAIDTANQLKHYDEQAVGEAVREFFAQGNARETLFLQTKFTSLDGQDHRLPYDPKAALAAQVRQSFASSLEHFGVSYVDSFLLHGPYGHPGLSPADWQVWAAIEQLHGEGKTKCIGISNVNAGQLNELVLRAKTKPHFVQNRCYANRGWDRAVRAVCANYGIRYQGFSLLTANPHEMADERVTGVARRLSLTPAQVIFAFCRQMGMIPLTGTTHSGHMAEDLASLEMSLLPVEIEAIEAMSG